MKALFFSPGDEILEKILSDQTSGATLIFKVLTTPFFDESMRAEVVKNVAKVLTKLKATPSQGYKRLMDEVGLSSRGGSRDHHRENTSNAEKQQNRPTSRQTNQNYPHSELERQYGGQFPPMMDGRPVSADQQPPFDPYALNGLGPAGGVNPLNALGAANGAGFGQDPLGQQQLQYQAYLAAQQARGSIPSAGLYPPPMGNSNFGYPPVDALRPAPNPGPAVGQQQAFPPQQFSPVLGSTQMYQYPPQFYSQPQPVQGQQPAGGRRGRVSLSGNSLQ